MREGSGWRLCTIGFFRAAHGALSEAVNGLTYVSGMHGDGVGEWEVDSR